MFLDFDLLLQYNVLELAKFVLSVFFFLLYFYLRDERTNRCPRCEKRGALVTTDVSDTALGYDSELYSYDANIFEDQPKDIRYGSRLYEFGRRSTRRKCKNCGFSVVIEEKYKERF